MGATPTQGLTGLSANANPSAWNGARTTAGIALLAGGALVVIAGGVATAAFLNSPFAQMLRLGALNGTLLGRNIMLGCYAGGVIGLTIGGILLYTARPVSKKPLAPEEAASPPPAPDAFKAHTEQKTDGRPSPSSDELPPPPQRQASPPPSPLAAQQPTPPSPKASAPSTPPSRPQTPPPQPSIVVSSASGSSRPPSPAPAVAAAAAESKQPPGSPSKGVPQSKRAAALAAEARREPAPARERPQGGSRGDASPSFQERMNRIGSAFGSKGRSITGSDSPEAVIKNADLTNPAGIAKVAELFTTETSSDVAIEAANSLGRKLEKERNKSTLAALFVECFKEYGPENPRHKARDNYALFKLLTYYDQHGIDTVVDEHGKAPVLPPTSPQIINAVLVLLDDKEYREQAQDKMMFIVDKIIADPHFTLDHFRQFIGKYIVLEREQLSDVGLNEKVVVKALFDKFLSRPDFIAQLQVSKNPDDKDIYTYFLMWLLVTNKPARGGSYISYCQEAYEELQGILRLSEEDCPGFSHPLLRCLYVYLRKDDDADSSHSKALNALRSDDLLGFQMRASYLMLEYYLDTNMSPQRDKLMPLDHSRVIRTLLNLCLNPQALGENAGVRIEQLLLKYLDAAPNYTLFMALMNKYAYWEKNKEPHKYCMDIHNYLRDFLLKYLETNARLMEWMNRVTAQPQLRDIRDFLKNMKVPGYDPSGSRPASTLRSGSPLPKGPTMPLVTPTLLQNTRSGLNSRGSTPQREESKANG